MIDVESFSSNYHTKVLPQNPMVLFICYIEFIGSDIRSILVVNMCESGSNQTIDALSIFGLTLYITNSKFYKLFTPLE